MKIDYAVIGGTTEAIKKALYLQKQGLSTMLFLRETYLATEICSTSSYVGTPDEIKKAMEELCKKHQVPFLYGVTAIGYVQNKEGYQISFAHKGGILEVSCTNYIVMDYGKWDYHLTDTYQMMVDKGTLLKIEYFWKKELNLAENLCAARKSLLLDYAKQADSHQHLGRFAAKTVNMCKQPAKLLDLNEIQENGESYAVVIAGGGTSGAMAAIHSARNGARTILIEPNYELGGTATVGGVNAYWFGERYSDVKEVDDAVNQLCEELNIHRDKGIWAAFDTFPQAVKSQILLEKCLEVGVEVVFGQIVYDVIQANGRICGVHTAGENGSQTYYGQIVLDATGDADLIFQAGGEYQYGSAKDGFTYWASLAQYTGIDSYKNNFSSMVRLEDPFDVTRFIVLSRQRGESTLDHGVYVSPRESRHICGGKIIDLRDVCRHAAYPDAVATMFSNYDPKGHVDADMVYCGYLPPQVKIQIPLEALMPINMKGIYVLGKAFSVTHNAFPGTRMQADLMHLGAVVGMLSAYAVSQNGLIEDIPDETRRNLIYTMSGDFLKMPERDGDTDVFLQKQIEKLDKDCRSHWIDVPFTYEEKRPSPLLEIICAESDEVLPLLQKKLHSDSNLQIKKLALWHGDDSHIQDIITDIMRRLADSKPNLPRRKSSTMCVQLLPDHGAMPETVYALNLLSCSRNSLIIEPFREICRRLEKMERDYYSIPAGIFYYVESFSYVALHTGNKEFIPLLHRLVELPEIQASLADEGAVELLHERFQMLAFQLFKALYALDDEKGRTGLSKIKELGSKTLRLAAIDVLRKAGQSILNDQARIW